MSKKRENMALVESESQLKSQLTLKSPADEVSDIYWGKCYLFPKIMPQEIRNVELVKDDCLSVGWQSVGSKRLWTFKDECGSWKDIVEAKAVVDETKSITWTLVDGKVPKESYNSLKVVYKFSPNDSGCLATVTLISVKTNDGVPDPKEYMDFINKMLYKVDNYLQNTSTRSTA
ncbi:hypothetical protein BT93_H0634 [Corymbia citriodora subsp. variegata]|nr:hypothetical protein BT93_H0634 [Corymbia citriodora subsp. variegata]